MQIGAEIRVSVADVDTDFLLSQNWPPSTLVHHGSCKSCSETDSANTDCKKWTERYGIPKFCRFRKSLATSSKDDDPEFG